MTLLNTFSYRIWSEGSRGRLQRFVFPATVLSYSDWFNYLFTTCVILNTFVLAVYHYGIDPETSQICDTLNTVFTVIFTVETLVKVVGMGLPAYCRENMNLFDSLIVALSIIELAFLSGSSISAFRAVRIFRIFRVLRVARLFRYMTYMRKIMSAIVDSLEEFVYLGLLLLIFTTVFALFGMQLFAGKFVDEQVSYDEFFYAFLATFQIMTSENWHAILHEGMKDAGAPTALYFIGWLFLGNFVMLNLFLAILLDVFSTINDDDELFPNEFSGNKSASFFATNHRTRRKLEALKKKIEDIEVESIDSETNTIDLDVEKAQQPLFADVPCANSLFLFSKQNRLRIILHKVTSSRKFESSIIGLIGLSSIKLVWETYLLDEPETSMKVTVSEKIDIVFTCLFTLEFIAKTVSQGFALEPGTYLRDYWNILDFCIVLMSLIDLSLSDVNIPLIKVFRLLRALRPLRFITHNISMKIIVNALLESFLALLNVIVVVVIVWFIFGILGVSLFAGKMSFCGLEEVSTKSLCEYYDASWLTAPFHFDNVLMALITLFTINSPENWPDTMYNAMDSTGIDSAMVSRSSPWAAGYFLGFLIISNFFFLNLFLGVIFDKFEKSRQENTSISELILQNDQYRWVEIMKFITKTRMSTLRDIARTGVCLLLYRFVNHWLFNAFIMLCIIGNMIVMGLPYAEASDRYLSILEQLTFAFTIVFSAEAVLKLAGFGLRRYFKEGWNRYDFVVAIASMVELFLYSVIFRGASNQVLTVGTPFARTLRVLRVARLFRILRQFKLINDLVSVLAVSLYAIMNVLALLVLIFVIYGVLGVFLFHRLTTGIILDEYNNFSNFGMAALLLIRTSTGEDWNYVLKDCAAGSNPILAHVFFLSFIAVATFVMLNLFVMVMLQEYESFQTNPESSFKLYKSQLKVFNQAWNRFAMQANRSKMKTENLVEFAYELGENVGVSPEMTRYDVKKLLVLLGLSCDKQEYIYYHEALFRFMRSKYGLHSKIKSKLRKKLLHKEEQIYRKRIKLLIHKEKMKSIARIITIAHKTEEMSFSHLIFMKSVFSGWKDWVKTHKEEGSQGEDGAESAPEERKEDIIITTSVLASVHVEPSSRMQSVMKAVTDCSSHKPSIQH